MTFDKLVLVFEVGYSRYFVTLVRFFGYSCFWFCWVVGVGFWVVFWILKRVQKYNIVEGVWFGIPLLRGGRQRRTGCSYELEVRKAVIDWGILRLSCRGSVLGDPDLHFSLAQNDSGVGLDSVTSSEWQCFIMLSMKIPTKKPASCEGENCE